MTSQEQTLRGATDAAPDAGARAVLDTLHPLLEPAPPSWMPQTVGWAVLAGLLLMLMGWLAWKAWLSWRAQRYRRIAQRELRQLRAALDSTSHSAARLEAARQLPVLVRRLALAHAARERVAHLQGEAWLDWLDRSLRDERAPFSQGAGRSLSDWAYRPESALPWAELSGLLALIERWIGQHQVPEDEA